MWFCEDCNIEITKYKKKRHIHSAAHKKNIGINPYHNAVIYQIVSLDTGKKYIGSTIQTLDVRLKKHKRDKKQYEMKKPYACNRASYEVLDNCVIELIENYPCETYKELRTREQYHIENNECININRATLHILKQYDKDYRENVLTC